MDFIRGLNDRYRTLRGISWRKQNFKLLCTGHLLAENMILRQKNTKQFGIFMISWRVRKRGVDNRGSTGRWNPRKCLN